jgi:group I intron endonuclease
MAKTGYIYKITSPTNKIYVGKTVNLSTRKSYYRSNNNKSQKIISNSIDKYGWDNHIFEVIDTTSIDSLNELEVKYIKELNSYHYDNPKGMNLTKGGDGSFGRKDSEETKLKRVSHHIGVKRSEKTKELMSLSKKGKPSSRKGVKLSNETKNRIGESNKGKVKPESFYIQKKETSLINFIKKYGSILQIDPISKNIIKEWVKLPIDISKELNLNYSSMLKTLKNKNKTSGGFIWEYKISWE